MDVGQGHVANSRCVTAMAPQEQALGQLPGAGPAEGAEFPRSSEVKELLERLWREQRGWGGCGSGGSGDRKPQTWSRRQAEGHEGQASAGREPRQAPCASQRPQIVLRPSSPGCVDILMIFFLDSSSFF